MTYNGPTRLTLELLSFHQNLGPLLIDVPPFINVPLLIIAVCPDVIQCRGSVVAVRESCDDDHLHVMCVVTRQAPRAVRGYLRPAEVLLLLW